MASKAKGSSKKTKVIVLNLQCSVCKNINYVSRKNKMNHPDRMEMNKYCKFCKKVTAHKETK